MAKAGAARVYRDDAGNVYACRPGVRRKLGAFDDPELLSACNGTLIDRLRATPRYVAWRSNTMCQDDPPRWAVHVLRISRTASMRSYPTGDACQTACSARSGIGPALRIALNPRGGLAWSALDVSTSTVHPIIEISVNIAAGAMQLARGADIAPDSVRWVGRHVTWIQAGTRRELTVLQRDATAADGHPGSSYRRTLGRVQSAALGPPTSGMRQGSVAVARPTFALPKPAMKNGIGPGRVCCV
jgi:hypothetical protein